MIWQKSNKKEITVFLMGGFGNQIFQIILSRYISDLFNKKLIINTSLLNSRFRDFRGLTKRNLSSMLKECYLDYSWTSDRFNLKRIFARFGYYYANPYVITNKSLEKVYSNKNIEYYFDKAFIIKTDATFSFLFNSIFDKYWLEFYQLLKEKNFLKKPSNFCVHVRRGDFLQTDNLMNSLGINYYLLGMRKLVNQNKKKIKIHICTDDFSWVSTNLENDDWKILLDKNSSVDNDFCKMVSAKNLIISNSSFSCAAAHISELSKRNKVYAPVNFHINKNYKNNFYNLTKSSWEKIDNG